MAIHPYVDDDNEYDDDVMTMMLLMFLMTGGHSQLNLLGTCKKNDFSFFSIFPKLFVEDSLDAPRQNEIFKI